MMQLAFLSGMELMVVVGVIVLLFGASKIPQLMRGMGQGIGEFKKGLKEGNEDDKKPDAPPAEKQPEEKK